jgi:hypothetical protein
VTLPTINYVPRLPYVLKEHAVIVTFKIGNATIWELKRTVLLELSLPGTVARIITYDRHDPGTSIQSTLCPGNFAPLTGSYSGSFGKNTTIGSSKVTTWITSSCDMSV